MRVVEYINVQNVIVDSYSISPQSYELALKLDCGEINYEDLPPIKVVMNKDGTYILKDGRHRMTAFRLLGWTKIKAKFYKR